MKNIKKFLKDNKNEIICGTIIGGLAAALLLQRRYYNMNFYQISRGLNAISWKPNQKFITLEEAKAALDASATRPENIAIIKDGNNYMGILLHEVE